MTSRRSAAGTLNPWRPNPRRQAKYDLKAADRKRNLAIQIGLTSIVVIFAVVLVGYIVMSSDKKPQAGEAKSVRVASSNVIKKEGSSDPKAVLSLYEDFLCPHCGLFEQQFGPTVSKLIDTGAVAADFYMVGILDRPQNQNYSSRAGGAAYCVADESIDAFRRFHAALYAQQPSETAVVFPDNSQLIEVARQAGAGGGVPTASTRADTPRWCRAWPRPPALTPRRPCASTARTYQPSTPDALVAKIKEIVGNVPGLDGAAPAARRTGAAAMTVAAPSDVQSSESGAGSGESGAGPDDQRGMDSDRRRRRADRRAHAHGREDRDSDQPRATCPPAASTPCCRAVR